MPQNLQVNRYSCSFIFPDETKQKQKQKNRMNDAFVAWSITDQVRSSCQGGSDSRVFSRVCSWEQGRDWCRPGPPELTTTTIDLSGTWQVRLHAANPLLSFPLVPVNMLDPIWKRFGCGHYGQCAAGIGPDSASDVVPFFQRRPRWYCAVLVIWKAWSGFGHLHLVWKQAGGQEAMGPVLAECNRPAISFPLSGSVAFFHRQPWSYCAKPAWVRFGSGWLCQVWTKRIRSGGKPVCKNHGAGLMAKAFELHLVNSIRHVSWGEGIP